MRVRSYAGCSQFKPPYLDADLDDEIVNSNSRCEPAYHAPQRSSALV
jgi:hypothetical protein